MQILPTPAATPLATTGGSSDGFTLHFPSAALLVKFLRSAPKEQHAHPQRATEKEREKDCRSQWPPPQSGSLGRNPSTNPKAKRSHKPMNWSNFFFCLIQPDCNSQIQLASSWRTANKENTHSFQPTKNVRNSPCGSKEFLRLVETIMTHDARLSAVIADPEIPRKLLGLFFVLFLIPHHWLYGLLVVPQP